MLGNGTLDTWQRVSNTPVFGVPGVALSSTSAGNVYSLDSNEDTVFSRCAYMSCWTPWAGFGPGLANEGLGAIGYYSAQDAAGEVSVVVRGLDNVPWLAHSMDDGASFGGFSSLGGAAIDAAPAATWFSPPNRTIVATHHSDGNDYVYNISKGVWTNVGHP
jgi:hypothetical protein